MGGNHAKCIMGNNYKSGLYNEPYNLKLIT